MNPLCGIKLVPLTSTLLLVVIVKQEASNVMDLDKWCKNLEAQAIIGCCFDPHHLVDQLKNWMMANWELRGIKLPSVQFLPNNHYLFLFEEARYAQQVLSQGIWLLRKSPLILNPWTRGFNPKGERPTIVPFWVDFPDLPL